MNSSLELDRRRQSRMTGPFSLPLVLDFSSLFGILLLFIVAVSVHDAALVVLNEQVIAEFESNPLGLWLLEVNGGDIWLFVTVKLLGTAAACAILLAIHEHTRRIALQVAVGLALVQAILLAYLCFG